MRNLHTSICSSDLRGSVCLQRSGCSRKYLLGLNFTEHLKLSSIAGLGFGKVCLLFGLSLFVLQYRIGLESRQLVCCVRVVD